MKDIEGINNKELTIKDVAHNIDTSIKKDPTFFG